MESFKKVLSVLLCALFIAAIFAGCKGSTKAEEITDSTMIIVYFEENAPFLYTGEDGKLTGFDVDLIESTFDSFKGDYKNYQFVQVEEGFKLGEDTAYTAEDGKTYTSDLMVGGMRKNVGTANEDYKWSADIIQNDYIVVVPADSQIKNYNDLDKAIAAVSSQAAMDALNRNSAIAGRLDSANLADGTEAALAALAAGDADIVVTDSISFNALDGSDAYTVLNGALDSDTYGFAFSHTSWYDESFNEAVKEMLSPDYGDGDILTPIVEKYFSTPTALIFTLDEE